MRPKFDAYFEILAYLLFFKLSGDYSSNIPDWLKSALMNELYFVADGGTIWFTADDEFPPSDPR